MSMLHIVDTVERRSVSIASVDKGVLWLALSLAVFTVRRLLQIPIINSWMSWASVDIPGNKSWPSMLSTQ